LSKPSSSSAAPIIILLGIAWAVVAVLFFLFFSAPTPDGDKPGWFLVGITVLETGAFAGSSIICARNWRSGQIVSGRNVWLAIGLGLLSYVCGNIFFFLWGNVWGLDPAVSLGDFFYLISYVCLGIGIIQAVLPRRLNLEPPQWLIIAGVGLAGVVLAYFLNYQVLGDEAAPAEASVPVQAAAPTATAETPSAPTAAEANGSPAETTTPEAATPEEPAADASTAPAWVQQLDAAMEPLASVVSLLYVLGDCLLVVLATTLLVAFWGGRFSQSWKLIAMAAFFLYIADMFFAYAVNREIYQEGSLWEVFWTLSAVFFGLGAAVEYGVSTRSRRSVRQRRAASGN